MARAGFCYRRPFVHFLERYKSLCPATWPSFKGEPRDGVATLLLHLKLAPTEYALGKTKIFIKEPKTVTRIEKAFQDRKPALATIVQVCARAILVTRLIVPLFCVLTSSKRSQHAADRGTLCSRHSRPSSALSVNGRSTWLTAPK